MYDIVSRLVRVRFTVGYLAALVSVSSAVLLLGPQAHQRVIGQASTNLHNLARGHLGTLWNSAFVIDEGPLYFWLPCLACLLALAELHLSSGRLTLAFVVGHVGATLLVAAGLAVWVELGWLPLSITRVNDVGISYGALAVLGALAAAISPRWRPTWIGWWLSLGLATAVIGGDFTDAGHAISLLLGMLVTMRFARPIRWTPMRHVLLAVSCGFGFLVLAHTGWTSLGGVALGVLGALAAYWIAGRRAVRSGLVPREVLPGPQPA